MRDAGPVQKMSPLQTGSAFEGGTWKVRSLPNPQSSCFQNSTDSSEARPCYGRQTQVVPCSPPPRADLAKVSGPLMGHASLNSSSSHPPSRPLVLHRPLQLSPRGQLKCLLELVSDSNHSSIQSPPPNTPQFCQHYASFQTPVLLLHYPLN